MNMLENLYGDVSTDSLIKRLRDTFAEDIAVAVPVNNVAPRSFRVNDSGGGGGVEVKRNKFSPVSIADVNDWEELRREALDLHELDIYLAPLRDSQSPMFRNIVDKYKSYVDKALAPPSRNDEPDPELSIKFVEQLAKGIRNHIHNILESCSNGIRGKASQPKEYYAELNQCVMAYFERIGLKIREVKAYDDWREVESFMKTTIQHVNNRYLDGKISEVFVQPFYFDYHDEDGELARYWVEGKCTAYKFRK